MKKCLISLLFIGLLMGSCAPATAIASPTQPPTASATPSRTVTETVAPSRTLHPIQTVSPTTTIFSVTKVRAPSETDGREVLTAFWSQDGSIIYYALVDETPNPLLWFELKINNGQVIQDRQLSSSPTMVYRPNFPIGGVYLEYQGIISPSKRYHFQITKADNYSLYILDSTEQSKFELLETPDMNFRGAYWTPSENSVVFGIGPEYGTFFYRYDIRARKLLSFEELVGYADPNVSEWALSPDGKHIAILDESLKLFSLDGSFSTTLPRYLNNVRWVGNSQKIYYYAGSQLYDPTSIGYFDIVTNTTTDLMQLSELEKFGVDIGSFFDVSPDGNQLVFWQAGNIWMVSFQ